MARRSNPKNLTAAEKRLDAKMAATTMRFKRYKEIQKRVMAVAKRVNAMPKHPRASALITWELMTGKNVKRQLFCPVNVNYNGRSRLVLKPSDYVMADLLCMDCFFRKLSP